MTTTSYFAQGYSNTSPTKFLPDHYSSSVYVKTQAVLHALWPPQECAVVSFVSTTWVRPVRQ